LIQQRVKIWQVKCCMTAGDLQQAAHTKSVHIHLRGKNVDRGIRICGRQLVHLSKTRCTSCKSPKSVKASLSSASMVVKGRLRKNSLPVGSSSSATHKPLLLLLITTAATAPLLPLLRNSPITAATAEYHPDYCCHCRVPALLLLPLPSTNGF